MRKWIAVPAGRNRSNGNGNCKNNGNRKSKNSCNSNRNGNNNRDRNRKSPPPMAIVHVVMKSSSTAPPAAAHALYIARDGQYQARGGLELVESGNMPAFAQENPQRFWEAADTFERKNGRLYTELQIALPRELSGEQRIELAREATRELLGERFAYTMAVHTPLGKDNIDQPHLHLMFSERVVDSNTQTLPEDQFFKRNGAKKDRSWNEQAKPMEVREKWVEMMNAAMERHGQEQRLDARSWRDQGRHDLAELVEPKLRGIEDARLHALREHVDGLREQRAELPAPGLSVEAAAEKLEERAEQKIAAVREREAEELSRLDRLIAAARELAHEVKDRTVAVAQNVAERMEQFRERFERWREQKEDSPGERLERKADQAREQTREQSPEQVQQRAGPGLVPESDLERRQQAFRERYVAHRTEQEQALAPVPKAEVQVPAPEQKLEQEPEQKQEHQHQISRGFGLSL